MTKQHDKKNSKLITPFYSINIITKHLVTLLIPLFCHKLLLVHFYYHLYLPLICNQINLVQGLYFSFHYIHLLFWGVVHWYPKQKNKIKIKSRILVNLMQLYKTKKRSLYREEKDNQYKKWRISHISLFFHNWIAQIYYRRFSKFIKCVKKLFITIACKQIIEDRYFCIVQFQNMVQLKILLRDNNSDFVACKYFC